MDSCCCCGDIREILLGVKHNHKMLHHAHCMLHCISEAVAEIAAKVMTSEETAALVAKLNAAKTALDNMATPPAP